MYFRPNNPLGKPVPNKSCPNCGRTAVYETVALLDARSGANITEIQKSSAFWGAVTCVVGMAALYYGGLFIFGTDPAANGAIPIWLPLLLGVLVAIIMRVVNQRKLDAAVRFYSYRCDNCKHRWQLREGSAERQHP
jgi:uncharacterized protein (DUF983 family)